MNSNNQLNLFAFDGGGLAAHLQVASLPAILACTFLLGLTSNAPTALAQFDYVYTSSSSPLEVGGVTIAPSIPVAGPGINAHASGMVFTFNKGPGIVALEGGTPAEQTLAANVVAGFNTAADIWKSQFNDPIEIFVDIDFAMLASGILGATGNNAVGVPYSTTRNALIADATSADDTTAVLNLQPGPNMEFMTNDTSFDNSPNASPRILDANGSGNNSTLDIPRANARALGLIAAHDPGTDGSITFSDQFSWDFNQGNGITGGTFDFTGVAAHEIGHLMGFISGVDAVDFFGSPNGGGGPLDLDPFRVYSVLDLYRYSDDSLNQPGQPLGGLNDLAYGRPSASDNPFFSIDGGATELATFSTGFFNGEGRQASHWKDNLGLGIMDPTFFPGQLGVISSFDVQAFDVIGFDLVSIPEPTTLVLMLACLGIVASGSRQRSR